MPGFGEYVPSSMTVADKIARSAEIEEQVRKLLDEQELLLREVREGR